MFIAPTNTILVEALREAFDSEHPDPDMRNLRVGMEYPRSQVDYPGIWAQFIPGGDVQNAGIGHAEHAVEEDSGLIQMVQRWRFSGTFDMTVVALSSLARANITDALVGTLAFGASGSSMGDFRHHIENNDLVGLSVVYGAFTVGGDSESQGTPWGTDDVVYEMTVTMTLSGEFIYAPASRALVPLSRIDIYEWQEGDPDPLPDQEGDNPWL